MVGSISLLAAFREAAPTRFAGRWRSDNIWRRFDRTLVDLSPRSRKNYHTDIALCMSMHLSGEGAEEYWNYPSRYDPLYEGWEFLSSLSETSHRDELAHFLDDFGTRLPVAAARTGDLIVRPPETPEIVVRRSGGRTTLSRTKAPPLVPCEVSRVTALKLDILLSAYGDLIDREFLDETLTPTAMGRVLRVQEELHGVCKNTIARRISALRRFEESLYEQKLLTTRALFLGLKRPRLDHPSRIVLSKRQMGQILTSLARRVELTSRNSTTKEAYLALRNYLMLVLLYYDMVRAGGLCSMNVSSIDCEPENPRIHVREKGRQERFLPLPELLLPIVPAYLDMRRQAIEECGWRRAADALFVTARGFPMNERSLSRIANGCAADAGVRVKLGICSTIGAHAFRRTGANHLYDRGAEMEAIRSILGHRSLETTRIYLRDNVRDVGKTLNTFHPLAAITAASKESGKIPRLE